jgi:bacteriocin-like protein
MNQGPSAGDKEVSHPAPRERFKEEIMSKSETMSMDTGKAGEPAVLTDKELDAVSGGMDLKGAGEALTQRAAQNGQNDPAQMFQQIMQQLTQGQG